MQEITECKGGVTPRSKGVVTKILGLARFTIRDVLKTHDNDSDQVDLKNPTQ